MQKTGSLSPLSNNPAFAVEVTCRSAFWTAIPMFLTGAPELQLSVRGLAL